MYSLGKSLLSDLVMLHMVRDLFGSILYLSLEKSINMAEVLTYPLTPVPLSLCHPNGIMLKTKKSALLNALETRVKTVPPDTIDITIIDVTITDAIFLLHLHPNLLVSFGGATRYLLARIMEFEGNEIHFVSDKWITPSITDYE